MKGMIERARILDSSRWPIHIFTIDTIYTGTNLTWWSFPLSTIILPMSTVAYFLWKYWKGKWHPSTCNPATYIISNNPICDLYDEMNVLTTHGSLRIVVCSVAIKITDRSEAQRVPVTFMSFFFELP